MKQQFQLWSLPVAIGLAAMVVALPIECTYARGRGGGGFARGGFGHADFSRGGFSREGPAAAGSFASRPESMLGHERGFASSALGGQANRMEYGQHAAASRQQEANALLSNREQAARNVAQQYRRAYPYRWYPAWDAGAGWAAAATGAAIGAGAAASMAGQPSATAAYPAGQPCANPVTVPVGSTTFFQCGSSWYREAYGPAGSTFVAVSPPGL